MARCIFLLFLSTFALALDAAEARSRGRRSADERLAGVERRRFDVLELIMEDADRAADREERVRLLGEYLEASEAFLRDHPDSITIWTGRVSAAIELNRPIPAWVAGQALVRLGADTMDDMKIRRALAMLDRRGWLGETAPRIGPEEGKPWENSLGMRFVPVEGTDVLVSIWETRVRDFTAFVEASGFDATSGMLSFDPAESTWKRQGASWRLPGFDQSADHPVVGVNWYDASAFCAWLTLKERRAGVIGDDQLYRLPYDAEWSLAAGPETFVWGEQWPPPSGAGNFLGEETQPTQLRILEGYNDQAPRTARVGQFAPNRFGMYDLAGNVEEWCEDFFRGGPASDASAPDATEAPKFRILRGSSWSYQNVTNLRSQQRHRADPEHRIDDVGFRCVLDTEKTATPAPETTDLIAMIPSGARPSPDGGGAPASELARPRPIHQVQPDYPDDMRLASESGVVVAEFTVDALGRVLNPRVISSSDAAFEPPTLRAVRDWRFEPARRRGLPVACRVIQEFRFNARGLAAFDTP